MSSNSESTSPTKHLPLTQVDASVPYAHSDTSANPAQPRVITIAVPTGTGALSGFGAILSALFLFTAWGLVGIGYLCVPGSVIGGFAGLFVGALNLDNGLAAAALGFGCGIACFGLCLPLLFGTNALRKLTLNASKRAVTTLKGE